MTTKHTHLAKKLPVEEKTPVRKISMILLIGLFPLVCIDLCAYFLFSNFTGKDEGINKIPDDICGENEFYGYSNPTKTFSCLKCGYTESQISSPFWGQNKKSCECLNNIYPNYNFRWNDENSVCCPQDLGKIFTDATFRSAVLCTSCGGTWTQGSIFKSGTCLNMPPALPECPCDGIYGKYCPDQNIPGGTTSETLKNSSLGYSSGICKNISESDLQKIVIKFNNKKEVWFRKPYTTFLDTKKIAKALKLTIPTAWALNATDSTGQTRHQKIHQALYKTNEMVWVKDAFYTQRHLTLELGTGKLSDQEEPLAETMLLYKN